MKQKIKAFIGWANKNYYRILAAVVVIILWWFAYSIVDFLDYRANDFKDVRVWRMN